MPRNSSLLGGGGVDGAIHRAGGPEILGRVSRDPPHAFSEGLPTGEAVITTGGKLPALYVIHTVGPIFDEHRGKEPELLANCYHNSLTLAVEKNLTSVAFPSISTGVYHYPRDLAARSFVAHDRKFSRH
jgi:O-acetyl-ADP-ribose deacetylase (regulator of RNase III)